MIRKLIIAQVLRLFTFIYLALYPQSNSSEFTEIFSLQSPTSSNATQNTQEKDQKTPHHWTFRTKNNNESTPSNITCLQKNQQISILCHLGILPYCRGENPTEVLSTFWVICPIYTANAEQTKHLYELHRNFRSYIQSYGISFQTVETIFPGQEFQLTKPNNEPYDLQYKEKWIFAMRENLVNVGIKRLPDDWQFVSWMDQHIFWEDPYWFEKAIILMSHNNVVHLLNGNDFLNENNSTYFSLKGVMKFYKEVGDNYWRYVPQQWGLAWATKKEIYQELGGLFDICIGTKCDLFQAVSYTGTKYPKQIENDEFNDLLEKWQNHAEQVYQKKVAYLDSKVFHFMHCLENCQTSNYDLQMSLLQKYNYSPSNDLVRDAEGRLSLVNNEPLAIEMWKVYGGKPRS